MSVDWTGNLHSVAGCLGANNFFSDRAEHDYYATDPKAVRLLLEIESFQHKILEPACGEGHIAKVLIDAGYDVTSEDLIDRGFGSGGCDFLKRTERFDGDIITNPPYKFADDFVRKSLETVYDGAKVAMFLKTQFLEGVKRRELFRQYPPIRVWVSSNRLKCGKNGNFEHVGNMISYCWYIWQKGYAGETTLKWFN